MRASQEMEGLPVTSSPPVSSGANRQIPSSHLPGPERTWAASISGEGGLSTPSLRPEQRPALPKGLGARGPEPRGGGPLPSSPRTLRVGRDGRRGSMQLVGSPCKEPHPVGAVGPALGTRVGGSGGSPGQGATGTGAPGRESSQDRRVRTPSPRRVFSHRGPWATPVRTESLLGGGTNPHAYPGNSAAPAYEAACITHTWLRPPTSWVTLASTLPRALGTEMGGSREQEMGSLALGAGPHASHLALWPQFPHL